MTLGRKLACYRKLAGLTQQQLGEHLNLSAQAISKWEKDLTEPDLATLRVLAELYKVTVDELLDLNSGFADPAAAEEEPEPEAEQEERTFAPPIGFCKECGVTVTEENLGASDPIILCKKCVAAGEERRRRAAAEEQRKRAAAQAERERALEQKRGQARHHRNLALVVGGLAATVFFALALIGLIGDFSVGMLCFMLIGTYVVFAFIFCLFYDCVVQDVVIELIGKSIEWPGLIFDFDLDGCLWYIGMRILFFILGVIFGIVMGIIGITLGLICAPFVFPFVMKKVVNCVKNGIDYE